MLVIRVITANNSSRVRGATTHASRTEATPSSSDHLDAGEAATVETLVEGAVA